LHTLLQYLHAHSNLNRQTTGKFRLEHPVQFRLTRLITKAQAEQCQLERARNPREVSRASTGNRLHYSIGMPETAIQTTRMTFMIQNGKPNSQR